MAFVYLYFDELSVAHLKFNVDEIILQCLANYIRGNTKLSRNLRRK